MCPMKLEQLLKGANEWVQTEGPQNRIVLSSRVRMARNLRQHAFPGWAKKAERQRALELLRPVIEGLPEMADCFSELMDNIAAIDKQTLVERHLISREHAVKNVGSGVIVSASGVISVMINEEDHLRMQAIHAGFQIKEAFNLIDRVDTELEKQLEYAFSPRLGYLTACPTNIGTGMRASAMVHLPGMVLSDQINQIIQAVNKLGLAVRGLYGEGTEAMGNMFQVSNQTTLGEREADIIERLNKVVLQIIEHEESARLTLLEKKPKLIYNHIGRAYGILTNAHTVASKEALNLLSLLRLGVDLELLPAATRAVVDELFVLAQPAHIQKFAARKLTTEERDILRADLIRGRLAVMPKPKIGRVPPQAQGNDPIE